MGAMRTYEVRTHRSAEELPRDEQLAWRIAELAATPAAVDADVADMVVNRVIDNAAVAAAALARPPAAAARAQAAPHMLRPGAPVMGLPADHAVSPEWAAWANGVVFARSDEGLRGRPVWRLEWKGKHRPPGYEQIPADLRVDHVYLVSCKYGSSILHNVAPSHLFDRRLAERRRGGSVPDWYADVAPEAYQELYGACRKALPDSEDVVPLP